MDTTDQQVSPSLLHRQLLRRVHERRRFAALRRIVERGRYSLRGWQSRLSLCTVDLLRSRRFDLAPWISAWLSVAGLGVAGVVLAFAGGEAFDRTPAQRVPLALARVAIFLSAAWLLSLMLAACAGQRSVHRSSPRSKAERVREHMTLGRQLALGCFVIVLPTILTCLWFADLSLASSAGVLLRVALAPVAAWTSGLWMMSYRRRLPQRVDLPIWLAFVLVLFLLLLAAIRWGDLHRLDAAFPLVGPMGWLLDPRHPPDSNLNEWNLAGVLVAVVVCGLSLRAVRKSSWKRRILRACLPDVEGDGAAPSAPVNRSGLGGSQREWDFQHDLQNAIQYPNRLSLKHPLAQLGLGVIRPAAIVSCFVLFILAAINAALFRVAPSEQSRRLLTALPLIGVAAPTFLMHLVWIWQQSWRLRYRPISVLRLVQDVHAIGFAQWKCQLAICLPLLAMAWLGSREIATDSLFWIGVTVLILPAAGWLIVAAQLVEVTWNPPHTFAGMLITAPMALLAAYLPLMALYAFIVMSGWNAWVTQYLFHAIALAVLGLAIKLRAEDSA